MAEKIDVPDCPFCSNALKPERITAERFVCNCCSREFTRDQVVTFKWERIGKTILVDGQIRFSQPPSKD